MNFKTWQSLTVVRGGYYLTVKQDFFLGSVQTCTFICTHILGKWEQYEWSRNLGSWVVWAIDQGRIRRNCGSNFNHCSMYVILGTGNLVTRCSSWMLYTDMAWHHLPSCVGSSSPLGSVFLEGPDLLRVHETRSSLCCHSALDSFSLPSAMTSEINVCN